MIMENKSFIALREKYKKRMIERIKADGYNPFIIEEEMNSFCNEWLMEHEKFR